MKQSQSQSVSEQLHQQWWDEVGMTSTLTPYVPYPYTVAPDAGYSGTVPLGVYRGAWQGVQKTNAIANVGQFWASQGMLSRTARTAGVRNVNLNNPTARYVGPGIVTATHEQSASTIRANPQTTSTWRSVLRRLRYGSGVISA